MIQKNDRTGEVTTNLQGVEMRIVKYYNNKNVVVQFPDGELKKTTYYRFSHGMVKPTTEQMSGIKVEPEDTNGSYMLKIGCASAIAIWGLIGFLIYLLCR
jgi:hypothetical protein